MFGIDTRREMRRQARLTELDRIQYTAAMLREVELEESVEAMSGPYSMTAATVLGAQAASDEPAATTIEEARNACRQANWLLARDPELGAYQALADVIVWWSDAWLQDVSADCAFQTQDADDWSSVGGWDVVCEGRIWRVWDPAVELPLVDLAEGGPFEDELDDDDLAHGIAMERELLGVS